MPKKSFTSSNPAMSFFSAPQTASEQNRELPSVPAPEQQNGFEKEAKVVKSTPLSKNYNRGQREYRGTPYHAIPEQESKTKKLQLLMRPSLFARIQEEADRRQLSVNEFIHQTMDENCP